MSLTTTTKFSGIAMALHWLVGIALHVLATLKHTFIDKDGTIFRMLPFGTAKG
jgi:cytochrome b561